jgi:NAD(P)-dependent dehydrogenase (short-subunit alcohol dehydrogenase family)
MELEGKNAIVVGGASGFGRATAQALARRGVNVAILDRPDSAGQEVADSLHGRFYEADVTDFSGTERALQRVVEARGGLHIAVTTAGGGSVMRTLTKNGPHDLEVFRQIQDLNTVATFNVSRLAAFHMSTNASEDDERGVIINTSSIAAFEGQIGQIAYSASKAAVAGMCLTMARDLGNLGIRVLAIAPSLFATGITADIPADMAESLTKDAAFPKRLGRPDEYAKLVLAIIENPMLNGQCIRLDAGQRFAPR